jgi:hypothetical protein
MCEICCNIDVDHTPENCPGPKHPDAANVLAAHKRAKTEARLKATRESINRAGAGSQPLLSITSIHTAHMASGPAEWDFQEDPNDPSNAFYDDGTDADDYWVADRDCGYSAVLHLPTRLLQAWFLLAASAILRLP